MKWQVDPIYYNTIFNRFLNIFRFYFLLPIFFFNDVTSHTLLPLLNFIFLLFWHYPIFQSIWFDCFKRKKSKRNSFRDMLQTNTNHPSIHSFIQSGLSTFSFRNESPDPTFHDSSRTTATATALWYSFCCLFSRLHTNRIRRGERWEEVRHDTIILGPLPVTFNQPTFILSIQKDTHEVYIYIFIIISIWYINNIQQIKFIWYNTWILLIWSTHHNTDVILLLLWINVFKHKQWK